MFTHDIFSTCNDDFPVHNIYPCAQLRRWRGGGDLPYPNQYGNMCPKKHPKENNVASKTPQRK